VDLAESVDGRTLFYTELQQQTIRQAITNFAGRPSP
jgi:hypothetical protein